MSDPHERALVDTYADVLTHAGWTTDEAEGIAQRYMRKIKADAWDECINYTHEHLMIGSIDQEEILADNPYREE